MLISGSFGPGIIPAHNNYYKFIMDNQGWGGGGGGKLRSPQVVSWSNNHDGLLPPPHPLSLNFLQSKIESVPRRGEEELGCGD